MILPMDKSVFISHSSKDAAEASQICEGLESRGLACWMAPRDIPIGTTYGSAIMDGVRECEVLLVALSDDSVASSQVEREVERATAYQKPIVPLIIRKIQSEDKLEYYLAGRQWLDVSSGLNENALDTMAAGIRQELAAITKTPGVTTSPPIPSASVSGRGSRTPVVAVVIVVAIIAAAAYFYFGNRLSGPVPPPPIVDKVPTPKSPATPSAPPVEVASKQGSQTDASAKKEIVVKTDSKDSTHSAPSDSTNVPESADKLKARLERFVADLKNSENIPVAKGLLNEVFRRNPNRLRNDVLFAVLQTRAENATALELERARRFMRTQQ